MECWNEDSPLHHHIAGKTKDCSFHTCLILRIPLELALHIIGFSAFQGVLSLSIVNKYIV
jgi:hypothetical protein